MAKRKRLTPFGSMAEDLPETPFPATVRPPIADMAGAAAATAAMEEMAATLHAAREGGRLVLSLPLDQVEAGYLVRDRIASDPEEMAALVESLRARGQQTPIEVAPLGPDRHPIGIRADLVEKRERSQQRAVARTLRDQTVQRSVPKFNRLGICCFPLSLCQRA